ncbi:unnamed protein product [Adineta steineri]|uniref:Arrestin C-terminal-like domain-containing protein n=1 Tax=Adineta steineri TaxID=433720 RepID=A0A815QQS6_9BILA|nr:unnamed protein product [Adineta steineri]CAF3901617.1 unnamed protein product [Adineta steineri]
MTNTVQKLPTKIVRAIIAENLSPDNVIYYDEHQSWVYTRCSVDPINTSQQSLNEVQSSSLIQNARPLESLGPFGTQPTEISITIEPDEVIYRTKSFNMILSDLSQDNDGECLGQHAPLAPITLHGTARSVSHIPHDATHFCWVYPPVGLTELCKKTKKSIDKKVALGDLSCTFLAFGGFVYFRINKCNNYTMLQANALVKADNGLVFHGPHEWQSAYTAHLAKSGRFQDVTVSSLIDLGIKYYCFINPHENLCSSIEGQPVWAPARNGGFVYLYGSPGDSHPLDRYFSIADAPITEQISTQVMPFSLIRNPHKTVERSSSSLSSPSSNVDKDRFNCSICLDRTIQCILIPCKHMCACAECAQMIKKKQNSLYMPLPVDEMKVEAQKKNRKDVHLHVTLHKPTIAVGNNVSFDIDVQNPKEVLIDRISVTHAQHLKLGPAQNRRVDILNETLKAANHFQNSHFHKNFHFFIPHTIPPTFSFHFPINSKERPIIVNYGLRFEAHLSGFSTNIRLQLPLIITDHPQNN